MHGQAIALARGLREPERLAADCAPHESVFYGQTSYTIHQLVLVHEYRYYPRELPRSIRSWL